MGGELDQAVRAVLDPGGERTAHAYTCPSCGRGGAASLPDRLAPLPVRRTCDAVLRAGQWRVRDNAYAPLIDPEVCRDPEFGFSQ